MKSSIQSLYSKSFCFYAENANLNDKNDYWDVHRTKYSITPWLLIFLHLYHILISDFGGANPNPGSAGPKSCDDDVGLD